MAKKRAVFVCGQCGNESIKWEGRCSECWEWDSLVEMKLGGGRGKKFEIRNSKFEKKPVALKDVETGEVERRSTGFLELNRVLGGGLVGGQAVLLAGEPGIGKSTLLLQVADRIGHESRVMSNEKERDTHDSSLITHNSLYVCGEESPSQIKIRADRLGIEGENIELLVETNVEAIVEQISGLAGTAVSSSFSTTQGDSLPASSADKRETPCVNLLIVDSIQSLQSEDLTGTAGSVGQVKLCSQKLIGVCKGLGIPLFLVGQVTKEGTVAGPKVLEHIVDTVLYLEGERMEEIRLMRSFKNRFGSVDELAVFKMGEKGMREVADASRLFLEEEDAIQPGAVLCPVVAGLRILLVEIQSLVVPTKLANPRRVSQGFSRQRLEMISAVLQKHLRLPLYKFDIFVNVSGGLSIDDPAADLAVGLSIYSSLKNKSLPEKSCAFGELSLLAGVRGVLRSKQRMEEVKRLGIKKIYSPKSAKYLPEIVNSLQ